MTGPRWAALAWVVVLAWVLVLLCSLKTGWLNHFFYDTDHLPAPGIDFYSVQRGWLNLLAGRSEFDTFHSNFGPYATWLNYHPLLAVVVGPWFTLCSPRTAYTLWTGVSVMLMACAAWVLSRRADWMRSALITLLLLGAFPTFILLQSGNVQAILVLSSALIFASLRTIEGAVDSSRLRSMLLAGLLLSLFSKPTVLAIIPLLLLLRETRRTTLLALGIYLPVSWLSLVGPQWNPQPLAWAERWWWISHPSAITHSMNVYENHFTVTRPMMDNAVHWFAMVGITDFRFLHVDIFSLSALLDGWLRIHTPDAIYRLPILLVLEVTVLVALVRDHRARIDAAIMVAMASSLLLILSYGVVWEYHYTLALPVTALLLLRNQKHWAERSALILGLVNWLPSLYFLLRTGDMTSLHMQTLLRQERVLPVLAMFLLLLWRAVDISLHNPAGLTFFAQAEDLQLAPN